MARRLLTIATILSGIVISHAVSFSQEGKRIRVWPDVAPGETGNLPAETNITKADDKPVGGRQIIKLTNVSTPTLEIFRPAKDKDTGTTIIVCPGGGHFILAYDHEGTEVAQWLATQGITGIVLKYRVPARDKILRWKAAVQDAQRAVSVVRNEAKSWGVDPNRIGLLGFSAGGETAALASIHHEKRHYDPVDAIDQISCRPEFAMLIYPGGYFDKTKGTLNEHARPTKTTPPMFLVHAFNDPVDARASILMASELKAVGVSAELHVYATGGHGYGFRKIGHDTDTWPDRMHDWLNRQGWLKSKAK